MMAQILFSRVALQFFKRFKCLLLALSFFLLFFYFCRNHWFGSTFNRFKHFFYEVKFKKINNNGKETVSKKQWQRNQCFRRRQRIIFLVHKFFPFEIFGSHKHRVNREGSKLGHYDNKRRKKLPLLLPQIPHQPPQTYDIVFWKATAAITSDDGDSSH